MTDFHDLRPAGTAMESMFWPMGESEGRKLPGDQEQARLVAWKQQSSRQLTAEDAALEGLRESDPEAYRMVVYSWA